MRAILLAGLLLPVSIAAASVVPASVDVAVLDRAVARGTLLEAGDFTTAALGAAQARGALAAGDAAGKEATRNLSAGSPVRAGDLVAPRLVRRGEPVNITVRSGDLAIATSGKALGSGGAGDLIRVVVTATNRTMDGVVHGPGEVRVAAR